MPPDDMLKDLREALVLSPENAPLRQHLGRLLLKHGRASEAETLYREGLALTPASDQLKLGLATAFLDQGKASAAIRSARG